MRAVRIQGYGMSPALEQVRVPELRSEEVLVRVEAASLNPLDIQLNSGKMHSLFPIEFPYTMGTDLAGTVERVGAEVGRWHVGDRVVARLAPTSGGALAEFAVLPAPHLAAAPEATSLVDAAGLPTAAGTAWQALFDTADLQPGQTVLIHAGAGGVGSFAVQLARAAGARVIATASGNGLDIARRLGADRVIDYRSERFEDHVSDVDVVLDAVRDDTQQRSFDVLRRGGCLASITSQPDQALARAHGVKATFVFHRSDASRLARVVERVDAGALKVLVDSQTTLDDYTEAVTRQASGRARGKVIVALR